ncbi:GNAT family protein [Mesorhizobium sp.]|uniref:GNAT family N-acetyltransferase n=1 Tax=Mesorhizobium sp. TaxID=1871066 RepID=UPI000FE48158|nr:GNAT family protein [Mesorhizobium sp.]RWP05100.1 MAG: N-acetyltransferase [Mesorhizobium sp.]
MRISFATLSTEAKAFLSEQTDIDFNGQDMEHWFCVTARNDEGEIVGVIVAEPKTWFDWHLSVACTDPRCVTRKLFMTTFSTLFTQAVRITALIDPANERAISNARRLGFVYEGFLRMGVEGRRDALMFGMLAEDCRFLPGFDPARVSVRSLPSGGQHHGLLA